MSDLLGCCLCGNLRYEATQPPLYSGFCHCSECRKFSGSAFSAVLGITASALVWVAGDEARLGCFWKTPTTRMRFCNDCGSSLCVEKLALGIVHLRMGTLDGDPPTRPSAHVFVGSKAPWFSITDQLPQYREAPPMPGGPESAGVLRPEHCRGLDPSHRQSLLPTDKQTFERCLHSPRIFAREQACDDAHFTDFYRTDGLALLGCHVQSTAHPASYLLSPDVLRAFAAAPGRA